MEALVTTARRNVGMIWVAIVNGAEKIDIRDTVIINVNETQVNGNITPDILLNKANKTTIITTIIKLIKTAESFISACLKIPAIAAEPDK